MRTPNYLLLSVREPKASAELYNQLLGCAPVEFQDTFVLYVLAGGLKIGLWRDADIQPEPKPAGGIEVSFSETSRAALLATYAEWKNLGMKVLQEPAQMDFGFTFVASDPDGHRFRAFVLNDTPR